MKKSALTPLKVMLALLALLVVGFLALGVLFGLLSMGDPFKHLTLKGRIVDEAGIEIEGCYLVIRGVDEGGSYAINNVPPNFAERRVVSSALGRYFVTVHCEGYRQPGQSKTYEADKYKTIHDLGTIIMKKEGGDADGNAGQVNREKVGTAAIPPDAARGYAKRGLAYYRARDYDSAIRYYSEAIRVDPTLADVYYDRGVAYGRKRDYDRAIQDFTEAIRLDPDGASGVKAFAYKDRGFSHGFRRDYDLAIRDYSEAIRLGSSFPYLYRNRGLAYQNKGDYDRAIQDYSEAIRLDPSYAVAYNDRGVAYALKGDQDKAIRDYDEAIRIDPSYALAYTNRDVAYERKGNYDQTIRDHGE